MPTLSAGSTVSLSLDNDDVLTTSGNGRFQVTPTTGSKSEGALTGTQNLGPFQQYVTVSLTALTDIVYSTATNSGVAPAAKFALDSSGNVAGLVGPGGGVRPFVPTHTLAIFGDSITAQCTVNTGTQKQLTDYGYIGWAQVLSNQAFDFQLTNNFGVAGETSTQILARISSVIAAAPSFCVVLAGTNDIYSGLSYATTISNLQAIYGQLVGAGINVIAMPIIPRAKDSASGLLPLAQRYMLQRINNWIRNQAQAQVGVYLADPTKNIVDYSATGSNLGDPVGGISAAKTAYTYDGLHPNPRGAWAMGKAIADVLALVLPPKGDSFQNPVDVYDATNNINGNVLANGQLIGSAGSLAGTATGTAATSWTVQGVSGTVAGSQTTLTLDNGLTVTQQTLTVGASSVGKVYQQLFAPASLSVGDTVSLECEVTVTSPVAVQQVELQVNDGTVSAYCLKNTGNGYVTAATFSGVLKTPPLTLTSIATITCAFQTTTDAGGSVTVAIRKISLKKT